ncbi:MAG: 4'-phosphopantetheinyl transferase superfamily protein [Proteobacteria bacterium]|nr:4'-phosphopantetheinyl transferase superfamily protein [Pseudomonadota bacterium]
MTGSRTTHRAEVEISPAGPSSEQILTGVQIWYVPHDPDNEPAEHYGTLTQDDVLEFASISNLEKRHRSLATRSVLRQALSASVCGRIAPKEWRFDRSESGKPRLSPDAGTLNFSCSHTRWASVVAVSTVGPIGIDIESAVIPSTETWLADVFTSSERSALESMSRKEREAAVSRLWSLKEAYLKMLGTGIAEALAVAFDPRTDRLCSGHHSRLPEPVTFRTWIAKSQGHRLSVAVAMSGSKEEGASRHQSIEEARVSIRTKLAFAGNRESARASAPAPLFRTSGAAAA